MQHVCQSTCLFDIKLGCMTGELHRWITGHAGYCHCDDGDLQDARDRRDTHFRPLCECRCLGRFGIAQHRPGCIDVGAGARAGMCIGIALNRIQGRWPWKANQQERQHKSRRSARRFAALRPNSVACPVLCEYGEQQYWCRQPICACM